LPINFSRRDILERGVAFGAASVLGDSLAPAAAATFQPTWESLAGQYRAPEWFRDAKFGIWAHWSAQCVPEFGDWYARLMYQQGEPAYENHLKTYGHPSRTGFMEIDNRWKAEGWEPEALLDLYVKAGAKYFVALANHHDNFDTYDSQHHAWNSVNVGPKRDIVGTWAKLARERGLRFGASNHSAHAWHWFQTAYGYDAEGPLAGVRYDAFHLTKVDGKGTWWEGLDPQELYCGPEMVVPDGIRSIAEMRKWHDAHDGQWLETPPPHHPEFARKWYLRAQDLIDQYRPDLVYFDDTQLPLGQTGLDIAAYYYNANVAWHGGALEGVITGKQMPPERRAALVEDVERGFADDIRPLPWQTDTCIGNWHYDRALYERHGYKSAENVVQRLCDTVSKNGNLLLSIPMRGDGTIDDDERRILGELAAWMRVNGESIFATRPWRVFGEGPTVVGTGMFGEQSTKSFTPQDVRFTTRAGVLYVQVLGRPIAGSVTVATLSSRQPGTIARVALLGGAGALAFARDENGLTIQLPDSVSPATVPVFRIDGAGLV
jgi:alpha-L-fucosidase